MRNFLKAEILEKKEKYSVVIVLSIILNIVFWIITVSSSKSIFEQILNNVEEFSFNSIIFLGTAFSIPVLLFMGLGISLYTLYIIVDDYKSDFFTGRAYLKFSQPISTGEYLAGKILSIGLWSLIVWLIGIVISSIGLGFTAYFMSKSQPAGLRIILAEITKPGVILYAGASMGNYLISVFKSLMILYFSITFVKIYMPNSKKGSAWIIVYIITSIILSMVSGFLSPFIPFALELNNNLSLVITELPYGYFDLTVMANIPEEAQQIILLSDTVFNSLQAIGFLLVTYSLIENKLEIKN